MLILLIDGASFLIAFHGGTEREYGYDACSRVTRVSYPTAGDPDQTYDYGLSGRLVQASRGESTRLPDSP